MTASKSSLFLRAWEIVRVRKAAGDVWTFGRALKLAWSELRDGEVWHWPTSPYAAQAVRIVAQNATLHRATWADSARLAA